MYFQFFDSFEPNFMEWNIMKTNVKKNIFYKIRVYCIQRSKRINNYFSVLWQILSLILRQ